MSLSETDFLVDVESCVTPADDVMIIYTSGSTGDPKGPVHSQGTLVRHTYNLTFMYCVTHDDVMFTAMPFFWVGGLITGLHAVIHHGATLVTQPAFDAAEALELMERHRATIALGWPQQGKTLVEHPDFAARDLSSVHRTSMPAMVPPQRQPKGSSGLGMTELCGNHLGIDPYLPQSPERTETGGPPIEGLHHLLVDPESGEPVPVGTPGEIWVRGYSLMQRLHKREREDAFTADGYYRTGDCGVEYDDGWIRFTGRLGDLIKTGGGTNVTPGEVELALADCDGVLEAYVVGAEPMTGRLSPRQWCHAANRRSTASPCGRNCVGGCRRTKCRNSFGSPPSRNFRSPRPERSRSRSWRNNQRAAGSPLRVNRTPVGHVRGHQRQGDAEQRLELDFGQLESVAFVPLAEVRLDAVPCGDAFACGTIRRTHDDGEQPVAGAGQEICRGTRAGRCPGSRRDELETTLPVEADLHAEVLQLQSLELKAQGAQVLRGAVEPLETQSRIRHGATGAVAAACE